MTVVKFLCASTQVSRNSDANSGDREKSQLPLTDGMRRPVSDGMLYAPKLSTRFEAQEIKETGNEEG